MRAKSSNQKAPAERVVKDIRRAMRKQYSAEDKIWIVLDGLRGEDSIVELALEQMELSPRELAVRSPTPWKWRWRRLAVIKLMSGTDHVCCRIMGRATSRAISRNGLVPGR